VIIFWRALRAALSAATPRSVFQKRKNGPAGYPLPSLTHLRLAFDFMKTDRVPYNRSHNLSPKTNARPFPLGNKNNKTYSIKKFIWEIFL
jgi:hypothetical protein